MLKHFFRNQALSISRRRMGVLSVVWLLILSISTSAFAMSQDNTCLMSSDMTTSQSGMMQMLDDRTASHCHEVSHDSDPSESGMDMSYSDMDCSSSHCHPMAYLPEINNRMSAQATLIIGDNSPRYRNVVLNLPYMPPIFTLA